MIEDEADVLRIEAGLADAVDDVIDVRLLGGVDHNEPVTGGDEPDRHEARADVVQVVEDLDGGDLLILDVVALAAAVALAERLVRSRSRLPLDVARQQDRTHQPAQDSAR